jgi:A/G-specific adenine glycosylase
MPTADLDCSKMRAALLDWYDQHARSLPWRVLPVDYQAGVRPNPYHIWLSEIMAQQTTLAAVIPYFERFLQAFPRVEDLASAELEAVLPLWAGLGYYARARNLHACAQAIVRAGGFPQKPEDWQALPGIGPYCAAAISAIAYDFPIVPVDGNVERVLSRLLHMEAELPKGKPAFRVAAAHFADRHRPGDFAQALMDLGATICTPKSPKCHACPWSGSCLALQSGDTQLYPRKALKKQKPVLYGQAFVHVSPRGLAVRRRPPKGLLGGMMEVPNGAWMPTIDGRTIDQIAAELDLPKADWHLRAQVRHIFTHIDLRMQVYVAQSPLDDNRTRVSLADLDQTAFPALMRKVIQSAFQTGDILSAD